MTHTDIQRLVDSLRKEYPWVTSVSYGKNQTGGAFKAANVVVFGVEKKLAREEISKDRMLPSEVVFEGNTYQTDVREINYQFDSVAGFPTGSRSLVTETPTVVTGHAGGADGVSKTITVSGIADITEYQDDMTEGFNLRFSYTDSGSGNIFGANLDSIATNGANFDLVTTSALGNVAVGSTIGLSYNGDTFDGDNGGNAPGVPQPSLASGERVQGGVRINNRDIGGGVGTLGTIARDIETQAAVLLTNAHVVGTGSGGELHYVVDPNNPDMTNLNDVAIHWASGSEPIGRIFKYRPVYTSVTNTIDAAVVALADGTFTDASHQQLNQTAFNTTFANSSPTWATDDPVDELTLAWQTDPDFDVFMVGQRTGAKGEGPSAIRLRITDINATPNPNGTPYSNCFIYSAFDSNDADFDFGDGDFGTACDGVSGPGDSGSGIYAMLNGEIKLIGLHFLGEAGAAATFGIGCRITEIANQLGVEQLVTPSAAPTVIANDGSVSATLTEVIVAGEQSAPTIQRMIGGQMRTLYRSGLTTDPTT